MPSNPICSARPDTHRAALAPFDRRRLITLQLRKLIETPAVRRAALLIGALAVLLVVIAGIDLQPNLARVKVAILSGSEGGNYYAVVKRLSAEARKAKGEIKTCRTQGRSRTSSGCPLRADMSTPNSRWCRMGSNGRPVSNWWPGCPSPRACFSSAETPIVSAPSPIFAGFRIGIGPEGSGTARLARDLLKARDLASLDLKLTHHPLDQQLSLLQTGELDLGVLVMDEDAAMVENAVRDRGLAILSFPQAEAIARRLPRVRTGHIAAGQYDAVRMFPPTDKTVLQVDALVVGNGCASRSTITGLLTLLARVFPDLLRRNKDTPNNTGLPLAAASRNFIEDGGPDLATQHVPWATDIMPLSNWIYAITAVSILFNIIGLWSKFRLWRIDAHRVKAEARLAALFRPSITPAEIARLAPTPEHRAAGYRAELAELITSLETLNTRCREQSLSWVAAMGQEMPYRYQEHLMSELLDALRRFAARVQRQRSFKFG